MRERVYEWAAPLYNGVSKALFFESRMRALAVEALEVKPGAVILDIGCGTGFHFPALREAIGHGTIVGIDTSRASIEVARRRAASLGLKLEGIVGDAAELGAAAGRFDAAIAAFSLSVIERWEEACDRAAASIAPGGKLVVLEQCMAERGWARALNPVARAANAILGASPSRDYAAFLSRRGLAVTEERFCGGLYAITAGRVTT